MTKRRKHFYLNRAAAAAAVLLIAGSTGVAYAANVGGIQRTVQLWIHGDQTDATLVIETEEGYAEYSATYQLQDGSTESFSGGGIAYEADGSERPLTEEEILQELSIADGGI